MATATKKTPAASAARSAAHLRERASLEFLTYRDNGGKYRWEIVDSGGESLACSGSFDSPNDAERAARYVFEGAGSARFERHGAGERKLVGV